MKSTMTKVAAVAILAASATGAQAVALENGYELNITSGTTTSSGEFLLGSGSFFGMDLNSNEKIAPTGEATAINALGPIVIGQTAAPGDIDDWFFNGATGQDWLNGIAITGSTEAGVTMGGWTVFWNGGNIDMSTGAWQFNPTNPSTNNIMALQTYANGVGNFSWDGTDGGAFTLDYTATVPDGGFAGTQYYLHLEGTVAAVPEASTYGMMLAGLGLVGFAVRRRKLVA